MCLIWKQWAICALLLSAAVAEGDVEGDVFDVTNYGAEPDGKTDIRNAVFSAWNSSCGSVKPSTVLIPKGTYLLGPVVLSGPCTSPSIGFQVQGIVNAPTDLAAFNDGWIVFTNLKGLTISGGGTFDGQGQSAWGQNDCKQNPSCKELPITLKFNFVSNTVIRNITSLNSKYFHISLYRCSDFHVERVKISAPGESPNTDGIHISSSQRINITDSIIATGDDCISVGPGTRDLNVTKVVCGPGHGISVGSLGKYKDEEEVNGVFVRNCTVINTKNGVRIKTFPSSPSTGVATNIVFEDIIVENAVYPVVLDQEYCPNKQCNRNVPSLIKLSNIKFNDIRGTTPFPVAVVIVCSRTVPCEHLDIGNINLQNTGFGGPSQAICSNVKPIFSGQQIPPIQCSFKPNFTIPICYNGTSFGGDDGC